MLAKHIWREITERKRFTHVSTDEVFGALGDEEVFLQRPLSMTHILLYSPASKASSDHFVRTYHDTYMA